MTVPAPASIAEFAGTSDAPRRLTWELLEAALGGRCWRTVCFIVSNFPQVAAIQAEVLAERAARPGPPPRAETSPFVYALR